MKYLYFQLIRGDDSDRTMRFWSGQTATIRFFIEWPFGGQDSVSGNALKGLGRYFWGFGHLRVADKSSRGGSNNKRRSGTAKEAVEIFEKQIPRGLRRLCHNWCRRSAAPAYFPLCPGLTPGS